MRNVAQPRATPRDTAQPRATPRNPAQPRATPRDPAQPRATPRNPAQPRATPSNPAQPRATPHNSTQPRARQMAGGFDAFLRLMAMHAYRIANGIRPWEECPYSTARVAMFKPLIILRNLNDVQAERQSSIDWQTMDPPLKLNM